LAWVSASRTWFDCREWLPGDFAEFVNLHDIRVMQPGGGLGFDAELGA